MSGGRERSIDAEGNIFQLSTHVEAAPIIYSKDQETGNQIHFFPWSSPTASASDVV